MNTNHLKYILTIARHKNISNAANELYISQPALTKTLNTIEDYYNIKIFDRSHTPLQITYAGINFFRRGTKNPGSCQSSGITDEISGQWGKKDVFPLAFPEVTVPCTYHIFFQLLKRNVQISL